MTECECAGTPHADTCPCAPDWRRVDDPPEECRHAWVRNIWRNTYGDTVIRLMCLSCGTAKPLPRGGRTNVPREKSRRD